MPFGRRSRAWLALPISVLLTLVTSAPSAHSASGSTPVPAVAELKAPALPAWVEQISPTGDVDTSAQIRIRFSDALIPVEAIESPDQQAAVRDFATVPHLSGKFRFLTPRMVGFQSDQPFPKAMRIRVVLKAGLADLQHHRLARDLAWTIATERIALSGLPGSDGSGGLESVVEPSPLHPVMPVTSNVELDIGSLRQLTTLRPEAGGPEVALKIELQKSQPVPLPLERFAFGPIRRNPEATWTYTIEPAQPLHKATRYLLRIAPGLVPTYGNIPSERAFLGRIETFHPLVFKGLEFVGKPESWGTSSRFAGGTPQLDFNNGLVAKSVQASIKVTTRAGAPIASPVPRDSASSGVVLDAAKLAPDSDYAVHVDAGLMDQFGQQLGSPVDVSFKTSDLAAAFWAPSGFKILPSDLALKMPVAGLNLPDKAYTSTHRVIQPLDFMASTAPLPDPVKWTDITRLSADVNQEALGTMPVARWLGAYGMLSYGVQAKTNPYVADGKTQWQHPAFEGSVQVTNLGVLAQWFPKGGLVRVHHLSDGAPVPGAAVGVYRGGDSGGVQLCASGSTDGAGTLVLDEAAARTCLSATNGEYAPSLFAVARSRGDWAFAASETYGYGYDFYFGWQSDAPESRGVIFSDRELYQPGERAAFTGMAYYLQADALKRADNVAFDVSLVGPDGQKTALGQFTTNEFGTFSIALPVSPARSLGSWTITAKSVTGLEISGSFRVAEFKPPNFKTVLTLDRDLAFQGDSVLATTQSNYLFGAPVDGGKTEYHVTRGQTSFTPHGWDEYTFGRQWFWPEEPPKISAEVLSKTLATDKEGRSSQRVAVAHDLPYPVSYSVDAATSDASNLSVSDTKSFTALPGHVLVGLKSDWEGKAGAPLPVSVVVTDPKGAAVANQRVHIELQLADYGTDYKHVTYKTVDTADTTSGTVAGTISVTPKAQGVYRIRAQLASDAAAESDLQIYVDTDGPQHEQQVVTLTQVSYKVGDTATAVVHSPYDDATLYFSVVRYNALYAQTLEVHRGPTRVPFTVTESMRLGGAVEAILIRKGAPLHTLPAGSLKSLSSIGFARLDVDQKDRYLNVKVIPLHEVREPGAEQSVDFTVTDPQGRAARAQLTVLVVNDAILQLNGYRPPDLVGTVFVGGTISTRVGDNRPGAVLSEAILQPPAGWEGSMGGPTLGRESVRSMAAMPSPMSGAQMEKAAGGAGTGPSVHVRTNFQLLAYYDASLMTDANGHARATFKLPDDLTTWRVMVVAAAAADANAAQDFRFGAGEATFKTSKPFLVNPILPQFARPGDVFMAGLTVTNSADLTGMLNIAGAMTGPIDFLEAGKRSQKHDFATPLASGTQGYRFPMTATGLGAASVQFTARARSTGDAFQVPLELRVLPITEQAVESGTTTSRVDIPVNVASDVVNEAGGLDVSIASTLLPEVTAPAHRVLGDDNGFLEMLEPAATRLMIAANVKLLDDRFGAKGAKERNVAAAEEEAAAALAALQKLQRADGGLAYWPAAPRSDPYTSSYAAEAIGRAQLAGIKVDDGLQAALKRFLADVLANPAQHVEYTCDEWCKADLRLRALTGLSGLGENRADFLDSIYQMRDKFDLATQFRLARLLTQSAGHASQGDQMWSKLQEKIYETGRLAIVNVPQSWWWMDSSTAVQSEALRLAIARQTKMETVDRLLQSLLSLRRAGTWRCPYDDARALTALVDYMRIESTPPNFTASVTLAAQSLASEQFAGYENPSRDVSVAMQDLPRGRSDLVLNKSGQGTLHYFVAYQYLLAGSQPGILNGLRVTRVLRPANQPAIIRTFGVARNNSPLELGVGRVLDIGLEIIADHRVDHVIISDPLPAGFEAVDQSFMTASSYYQAQSDSWAIDYQTIYRDRVMAYADHLEPGVYGFHYLVRSVTPGTYAWPGAQAYLQFAPEEFGRSASATVKIRE
jgi:alpha-2-macroglobulin